VAKCDLSIEIDGGDRIYTGGDIITGVVRVNADKDVNCSGLQVRTLWATHGRGNVDSEEADSKILFTGQWVAGEEQEYRFELNVGGWPPTYHGHYLNVDHYIEARAKIPWGFDPKATVPFRLHATHPNEETAKRSNVIELKGPAAALVGLVFLSVFLGMGFAMAASFGWIILVAFFALPLFGGLFVAFRFLLPKWALGEVVCEIDTEQVSPGQEVTGELTIQPRKNVSINGITLKLSAKERCVSGSGSNRTTHTHQIFDQTYKVEDTTSLRPNEKRRFPLCFQLPTTAPYSLDLGNNDLIWSANVNVDIPRWPDWRKTISLNVLPSGKGADGPIIEHDAEFAGTPATSSDSANGEITFAETASHLWSVRDNREQTEMLVDAVTGLTFDLQARVERRLLYSGDDDPHVFKDGYAIWAHYPEPELPMVLYVPHDLADEFEQIGREVWRGRGTIVGYDTLHGRLQVKLEQDEAERR
tara:strand:+ start:33499 stop:34917 length:1419 start_codon:yes stop_codon:yes gene_type:complete